MTNNSCYFCGVPVKRKYCADCRDKRWQATMVPKELMFVYPKRPREQVCQHKPCGKTFRYNTKKRAYCSRQCADIACSRKSQRTYKRLRQRVECRHCGAEFYRFRGDMTDTQTCSDQCAKERKSDLQHRRNIRRRVAEALGEEFNIFEVFQSASWKCESCGIDTPRELRGTTEKNAPELDHVVPLSKGGIHSLDNVQLLCKRCNSQKRDSDNGAHWRKDARSDEDTGSARRV